ncbi:MAG TPA: DNA/RNA nuclease SfsA, partial [Dongiaceae bacterium]
REVPDGDASRLDFHLSGGAGPDCWLEVKSVTMSRQPGLAEWPDARSSRGARHLEALSRLANGGAKATLLFLTQRPDCTAFRVAGDIDPAYGAALRAVDQAKVRILSYDCAVSPDGIELRKPLTILWN